MIFQDLELIGSRTPRYIKFKPANMIILLLREHGILVKGYAKIIEISNFRSKFCQKRTRSLLSSLSAHFEGIATALVMCSEFAYR